MSGRKGYHGDIRSYLSWGIKTCLLFKPYDRITLSRPYTNTQSGLFLFYLKFNLDSIKLKAAIIITQPPISWQMLYIP